MYSTDKNIILTGVHMELNDDIKLLVHQKFNKLFRHEHAITFIRIELIYQNAKDINQAYICKGHIEVQGPSIVISVSGDQTNKVINQLAEKLDRKLIKRARLNRIKRKILGPIDIPAFLPKII